MAEVIEKNGRPVRARTADLADQSRLALATALGYQLLDRSRGLPRFNLEFAASCFRKRIEPFGVNQLPRTAPPRGKAIAPLMFGEPPIQVVR